MVDVISAMCRGATQGTAQHEDMVNQVLVGRTEWDPADNVDVAEIGMEESRWRRGCRGSEGRCA